MWMVANEDYWGGRPYIDELVFRYYGNEETMLMALQKGEIDAFGCGTQIPVHALERIKADPNIKVEIVEGLGLEWLSFNLHKETPLQDKNVRHAILYGIDRDRLVDMVYLGHAEKYDSWVYTEDQLHHPNLPQYDYDPEKANEILDSAGYRDTDGDGIRNDPDTGENLVIIGCVPLVSPGSPRYGFKPDPICIWRRSRLVPAHCYLVCILLRVVNQLPKRIVVHCSEINIYTYLRKKLLD